MTPRPNMKYLDLAVSHAPGRVKPPTMAYRLDVLKVCTWSLAVAFSLSVWVGLFLIALWIRG